MSPDDAVNAAAAAGVSANQDEAARGVLTKHLTQIAAALQSAGLDMPTVAEVLKLNACLFWAGYGAGHSATARAGKLFGEN